MKIIRRVLLGDVTRYDGAMNQLPTVYIKISIRFVRCFVCTLAGQSRGKNIVYIIRIGSYILYILMLFVY